MTPGHEIHQTLKLISQNGHSLALVVKKNNLGKFLPNFEVERLFCTAIADTEGPDCPRAATSHACTSKSLDWGLQLPPWVKVNDHTIQNLRSFSEAELFEVNGEIS